MTITSMKVIPHKRREVLEHDGNFDLTIASGYDPRKLPRLYPRMNFNPDDVPLWYPDRQFIIDLCQSKYWSLIMAGHKIVYLYVGGSRRAGVPEESSDYDLVAYTLDRETIHYPDVQLVYKGHIVHWYLMSLYQILTPDSNEGPDQYGTILHLLDGPRQEIYKNPTYFPVMTVYDELPEVKYYAHKYMAKELKYLIEPVFKENSLRRDIAHKWIYYIMRSYYDIKGISIGDEERRLLLAGKAMAREELSLNDQYTIINMLKEYYKIIEELPPIDEDLLKLNWLRILNAKIKECIENRDT